MITETDIRSIIQTEIRRIFREELALALELFRPAAAHPAPSSVPTPALNAVREMTRQEQIDVMARNPALAREMFKKSGKNRTKKAA